MRFLISRTVKLLPPVVRGSRSQVIGAETGAPGRARVEYGVGSRRTRARAGQRADPRHTRALTGQRASWLVTHRQRLL